MSGRRTSSDWKPSGPATSGGRWEVMEIKLYGGKVSRTPKSEVLAADLSPMNEREGAAHSELQLSKFFN